MFSFLKKFLLSSKSISISELAEILKRDKIKLLDVRTTSEYQGGHIRGAQYFPLERIGSYQGKRMRKSMLSAIRDYAADGQLLF